MATFQIGETVICSITVKSSGTLADPATSMNVVIDGPFGNVVSSTAMTKDATGLYHYDFATASKDPGEYKVTYTATDGTRITISRDTLGLES